MFSYDEFLEIGLLSQKTVRLLKFFQTVTIYVPVSLHGHWYLFHHHQSSISTIGQVKTESCFVLLFLENSKIKHFFIMLVICMLLFYECFCQLFYWDFRGFFFRLCKSSLYKKAVNLLSYLLAIFFSICHLCFDVLMSFKIYFWKFCIGNFLCDFSHLSLDRCFPL